MKKIIDLSSMFEERMIDVQLKSIQEELLKQELEQDKLYDLTEELESLYEYVSKAMSKSAKLTDIISEKKLEIGRLLNTCYSKWLDKEIDHISEDIDQLGNANSDETLEKIKELKSSIAEITFNNALSLENRHLIQIAKDHLQSFEKGEVSYEPVRAEDVRIAFQDFQGKRDFIDDHEIALGLYEMSGEFYNNNIKAGIELFYNLPKTNQDELVNILEARGASIQALKTAEDFTLWQQNLFIVIQTTLGYANHLVDGLADYHFPEKDEIIELFNDPFFHKIDIKKIS